MMRSCGSGSGGGAEAFGGRQADHAPLLRLAAGLHLGTRDYQGALVRSVVLRGSARTVTRSDPGPARGVQGIANVMVRMRINSS